MAFSLSGGVSGAASGAQLGSFAGPWGTAIGGIAGGVLGAFSGKKKSKSQQALQFKPYSGLRPPRIDYTNDAGESIKYLRPTQDLTQKTIMDRSQGVGVGYDPAWLKLNTDLINSNANMAREDSLRDARGRTAASGLSGNLRAQEALAGRVNRDADRGISDSIKALSIADLERKNQERDVNTARLQALNSSNFGQENTAADFDKAIYGMENNAQLGFGAFGEGQRQFDIEQANADSEASGLGIGSLLQTKLPTMTSPSVNALSQGKGLNFGSLDPNLSSAGGGYRNYGPIKRNLVR